MLIVEIAAGVVAGLWLFGAIGRWSAKPTPEELARAAKSWDAYKKR